MPSACQLSQSRSPAKFKIRSISGIQSQAGKARAITGAKQSSAITEGVGATAIPASRNASILAAAVPLPPLTIAPAWPIRRPGGAVGARDETGDRFLAVPADPVGGFFFALRRQSHRS